MRTTITLDDHTLRELMSSSKSSSVPKAILEAVKWYVKRQQKEKLLSLFGKVDLDLDLEKVRASWQRNES